MQTQLKFQIIVDVLGPSDGVPYYEARAKLINQTAGLGLLGIGKTEPVAVRRAVYAAIQQSMKNKIYYNPDQLVLENIEPVEGSEQ